MEFHEAASFLFDLRRFRMKPGTESTARLLADLGAPHTGPTYIQIAGSNGKGSTAKMVETVLREAGLKVGRFTSPHLDDLRDQVTIDGRPMSKQAVSRFVEEIQPLISQRAAEEDGATFFEVLTTMALWHFGRQDVDVGVLEVGIGGRYDATSVVDPTVSAVTAVSLEHTELLGDTVEEIARDKAQVAPDDGPLVTATTGEALAAVRSVADNVTVVGDSEDDSDPSVVVEYEGLTETGEARVAIESPDWAVRTPISLVGRHQARNAGVAAAIVRALHDVDEDTIARGLRSAHWPGRFELMGREPLIVLDGAHNPAAIAELARTLQEFEYGELTVVFGAMHDKDHPSMVERLPEPDGVITCEPATDRAADPAVLTRAFRDAGIDTVESEPAVEDAVEAAIADAGPETCVLVTGSLYVVAEARRRWSRSETEKRVESAAAGRDVLERAHVAPTQARSLGREAHHRVVSTRVLPRQAVGLREAMLRAGGECAVSAVSTQSAEYVDVVLMGTQAQFDAALEDLASRPDGLASVAGSLSASLAGHDAGPGEYPWTDGTAVMGIVNVTPDSFHDGGRFGDREDAISGGERMAAAGADIIDIGGESTRPGADPVSPATERDRVVPVIESLASVDPLISVDTRRASVAEAALEAGADLINDVSGLGDPAMRFVAAEHDVPLVVMHSIDTPVDPDRTPEYDDVVEDVVDALSERVLLAERAGLDRSQIVVDPGLGFGKTAAENFTLLDRVDEFQALGCPVMVGHSHKSMFDAIGYSPDERSDATVAATAVAAMRGADIIRVHDVPENLAAVRTVAAATGEDSAFE
jgi:dihydropteroate synthase